MWPLVTGTKKSVGRKDMGGTSIETVKDSKELKRVTECKADEIIGASYPHAQI